MGRYRKIPHVVDAIRYKEYNSDNVLYFMGKQSGSRMGGKVYINTPQGRAVLNKGDWVVRGIENEYYPITNERFEKLYEKD